MLKNKASAAMCKICVIQTIREFFCMMTTLFLFGLIKVKEIAKCDDIIS